METIDTLKVNAQHRKLFVINVKGFAILKNYAGQPAPAAISKPDTDDDYLCAAVTSANSPIRVTLKKNSPNR